ncbi:MAG: hypothetical protein Q7R80_00795 [bacterium]|nr:hypothetical protein [bacterium]
MPISEKTAERLNALMRPADGTNYYAIYAGILGAVADEPSDAARIEALAYVFANKPFARWSGPPTPASEYPPHPDFDGRDRAAFEAVRQDRQLPLQLVALSAQIEADQADIPERAKRAWAFLSSRCPTPMAKVIACTVMMENGSPFLGREIPPTGLRFTEEIPKPECDQIRWRNRQVLARLRGISSSDAVTQKAGLGAAVFAALSEVSDERERAFILGDFIDRQRRGGISALAIELPPRLAEVLGAALGGEPCPNCGKVHGQGEHEGE